MRRHKVEDHIDWHYDRLDQQPGDRLHANTELPAVTPKRSTSRNTNLEHASKLHTGDSYEQDRDDYTASANNTPGAISRRGDKSYEEHGNSWHARGTSSTSSARTFATYRELADYMQTRRCSKCNWVLIPSQKDVEVLFKNWLSGQAFITCLVKCKRCSMSTCIGCGATSSGKKPVTVVVVDGVKLSWCCSRGRMFLIWIMLCGFDQQYGATKQQDAPNTGVTQHIRVNGSSGVGYGGFGFSSDDIENMLEYGRHLGYGRLAQTLESNKIKAQNAQSLSDKFDRMIFGFLGELLPSHGGNTHFDMYPPDAITSMLLHSKILDKVAELLRNDSLDDLAKRKNLYQSLLDFVRLIGTHPRIASQTMFNERILRTDTENLLTLSFAGSIEEPDENETSSSLADCLRNLGIQSNMMLTTAQHHVGEFHTDEGQDILWLCRQIADLAEFSLASTKGGTGGRDTKDNVEADHGISEIDDQIILANSVFGSHAQRIYQSPRGRMKRLITDITNLKTGLPPGIFVKYGSSRIDVMKVLIVGPMDTPYENGLFEFDLLCPVTYPQEPPKVFFRGANGRVSFNPNLHSDGKVCLSLLGTWAGEQWSPAESTILQVLVSVQAMILCEHPFANEPGAEMEQGTQNAIHYNLEIRGLTTKYAILGWLQNPPTIWEDIAVRHFKKNGTKILQTLSQWDRNRAPTSAFGRGQAMFGPPFAPLEYISIAALRRDVHEELQKLGVSAQAIPPTFQDTGQTSGNTQGYGIYGHGRGFIGGYDR